MTFRKGSLLHLLVVILALWLTVSLSAARGAYASDASSQLRGQIIDAGMVPWSGKQISLDEGLRGPNRETVSLRELVGKPILAYNYAEW